MTRFFLPLIFAFTACSIFAKKNIARIDSLNFKSELLYSSDVEESIKLSFKALQLAKQVDYEEGEAFASLNLAIANDIQGNSKVAIRYFQRAIHLYRKHYNNTFGTTKVNHVFISTPTETIPSGQMACVLAVRGE